MTVVVYGGVWLSVAEICGVVSWSRRRAVVECADVSSVMKVARIITRKNRTSHWTIDNTDQQKNLNCRVEHCLVRNTCPESENRNFLTRTCTVFAKSCFEILKIIF